MTHPDDIMKAARAVLTAPKHATRPHTELLLRIASAIENERKRCAAIARKDCRTALAIEHEYKPTWYVRAMEIAAEIEASQ